MLSYCFIYIYYYAINPQLWQDLQKLFQIAQEFKSNLYH